MGVNQLLSSSDKDLFNFHLASKLTNQGCVMDPEIVPESLFTTC